jgi:murein L,D-transpeptidase YcbB/YkuD
MTSPTSAIHPILAVFAFTLGLGVAFASRAEPPRPPPSAAPSLAVQPSLEAPAFSAADRVAILEALAGAPSHGLPSMTPAADATDQSLADAAVRYATWQHGGRIRPASVDPDWGLHDAAFDARAALGQVLRDGRVAEWLAMLPPASDAYRRLLAERQRYAAVAANGGWGEVRNATGLREGASGPAVAVLRTRLAIEGFATPATQTPDLFDPPLTTAVIAFQAARGLAQDGLVGPAAIAALNRSPDELIRLIDVNLERERWAPRSLPADRLEVNIAATELILYRDGAAVLTLRTVVGKRTTHTPIFASAIQRIVFNPPWIVPASIAQGELLPHGRAYLTSRHISTINGQLVQAPGEDSALGVLKFDFPNPYGVYLHDTGARGIFAQADRFLSHGCVRVQRPRELAAALLGWSEAEVDAHVARRATHAVPLARAEALLVAYRTATVGDDGHLRVYADAYGWDRQLANALAGN